MSKLISIYNKDNLSFLGKNIIDYTQQDTINLFRALERGNNQEVQIATEYFISNSEHISKSEIVMRGFNYLDDQETALRLLKQLPVLQYAELFTTRYASVLFNPTADENPHVKQEALIFVKKFLTEITRYEGYKPTAEHVIVEKILQNIHLIKEVSLENRKKFYETVKIELTKIITEPDVFSILKLAAIENIVIHAFVGVAGPEGIYVPTLNSIMMWNAEKLFSTSEGDITNFMTTLVHETTHFIINTIYLNEVKAFAASDLSSLSQFNSIDASLTTLYQEKFLSSNLLEIISESFEADYKIYNTIIDYLVLGNHPSKDSSLYYNYSQESYCQEAPAFYTESLALEAMDSSRLKPLLLKNISLSNYMKKIYTTARLDTYIQEILLNIFNNDSGIKKIIIDYIRPYSHKESSVLKGASEEETLALLPSPRSDSLEATIELSGYTALVAEDVDM